jgi:hypothetical protein
MPTTTIPLGVSPRNGPGTASFAPEMAQGIPRRENVTGNRPSSSDLAVFEPVRSTLPRAPRHLSERLDSEPTFSSQKETDNKRSSLPPLILDEFSHQNEMKLRDSLHVTIDASNKTLSADGDQLSTSQPRKEVDESWRKDNNPKVFDLDKVAEKYVEANKSGVNVAKRSFFFKLGVTVALGLAAVALIATGGIAAGAIVGAIAAKMAADTFCSYMELANARAKAQDLPPKYDLPMGSSAVGNMLYKGLEAINVKPENCKKWAGVGSLAFDTLFNTATGFALGGVVALPFVAISQISNIALFFLTKDNDQFTLDAGKTVIQAFKQLQENIDHANAQLQLLPEGSEDRKSIEGKLDDLQDQMNEQIEKLTEKIDKAISQNAAPEVGGALYMAAGLLMAGGAMFLGQRVPDSHPQCGIAILQGGVAAARAAFAFRNQNQQVNAYYKQNTEVRALIEEIALKSQKSESVDGVFGDPSHPQPVLTANLGFV